MRILIFLFTICCMAVSSYAGELKYYGNFKKMMHMKDVSGVVNLRTALTGKHINAVGAIKNAEGEITVYDGQVWLSYGENGSYKVRHEVPPEEQAMLLVTAEVEKWKSVIIPKDMDEFELYEFILAEAKKSGVNTNKPFPFLIEGVALNLRWHVINGTKAHDMHGHGGHEFINSIVETSENSECVLIGFYSSDIQGIFTHPGESWHIHTIIKGKDKAGHVEKFSVGKRSILKIPEM